MRKNVLFLLGLVIIFVLNVFIFTQKNHKEKNSIDVKSINQSFESVKSKLQSHKDYDSIVYYVRQIEHLQTNAKSCISESESHLKDISDLLRITQLDHVSQLQRADNLYLSEKQLYYAKQLSECRLFVYRSQEVISEYKNTIQKLSATQILKRSTPMWALSQSHWLDVVQHIDFEKMILISGLTLLTSTQWVIGYLVLIFALLMAVYIRSALKGILLKMENSHILWRSFLNVSSRFIVPCTLFGFYSVFLSQIYENRMPTPSLELLSHALLIYLFAIAISKYLFFPSRYFSGLFLLPIEVGRQFYRRIEVLFTFFLVGYIVSVVFREQAFPASFIDTVRTLYITLVGVTVMWAFYLWHRSPLVGRLQHGTTVFLSTLFTMVLSGLVIMEWFGYHRLAVFAFKGLFLTMIYTTTIAAVWRLIEVIYQWVDNKQYALARKVHQLFGVKFNKKLHEFTIIKMAVHLTVLSIYVIAILKSWDIAESFVGGLIDGLLHGFKFLGFTIIPLRLILALIAFAVILLMGRFLATSIAQKQHLKGEEDTQIAISTITIYISFSIALIFALLVTGIDFTGLAIIAGALSVGVGLGLQTIVNNFVSGLILLIEKPIKPGDRIVIGKTEGFERKIRIRSTQIATLSKEDVIVPNADLITQQVTNCMFRDRNSRVSCAVCVAYGSDVDLVKKLLLEVAEKNDDVVHEAPNEPVVLFSSFGNNGLHFDLWCVIHDVNKKYRVVSELNFAIDAEFRKHNVVMAYPQTDIHIKDYTVVK